jgi:hypothetical protein
MRVDEPPGVTVECKPCRASTLVRIEHAGRSGKREIEVDLDNVDVWRRHVEFSGQR